MQEEFFPRSEQEAQAFFARYNQTPHPDLEGLSPDMMHALLYSTFDADSPIGFKEHIEEEVWDGVPFMALVRYYLALLERTGEIKLTSIGNIPPKICREVYGTGILTESAIEKGITKLSKEQDSVILQKLKIVCNLTGLTKIRNNKLSITKKGMQQLKATSQRDLFTPLFITSGKKFNLGYFDGFPQELGVQRTLGFTLYLLLRYGQDTRPLSFYADLQIRAFPSDLEAVPPTSWTSSEKQYAHGLGVRIFMRFLVFYGLVDYQQEKNMVEANLRVSPTFQSIFTLKNQP